MTLLTSGPSASDDDDDEHSRGRRRSRTSGRSARSAAEPLRRLEDSAPASSTLTPPKEGANFGRRPPHGPPALGGGDAGLSSCCFLSITRTSTSTASTASSTSTPVASARRAAQRRTARTPSNPTPTAPPPIVERPHRTTAPSPSAAMSSYPGSSGLASTNTYQLVIISVIAAAILVAAVTTLLYRRHRHQQIMRNLPPGGYVVAPPPPAHRRKRRRDVGPEPVVWDALVGEEEDEEDESDGEVGEKEKAEAEWLDDPEHWHPVAIALPPHESVDTTTGPGLTRAISQYETGQRPETPALDMTLLIAMPDPSLPMPADDGAYPLLRVGAHEDGALPPLQLSTARVAVDSGWDALDKLCPPPPAPQPTAEHRVQRVRVDGFSRTILRLPSQRP